LFISGLCGFVVVSHYFGGISVVRTDPSQFFSHSEILYSALKAIY